MKNKILKAISALLVFIMVFGVSAFAVDGTLQYWYSNLDHVYRFKSQPSIWSKNYANGFTSANISKYIDHAKTEWYTTGGFSCSYAPNESSASIKIYSGSYDELKPMFKSLVTGHGGLTVYPGQSYESAWIYGDTSKDVFEVTEANFCVVNKGSAYSDTDYKCVTTHEFGHALGWGGHSEKSSDVMFGAVQAGSGKYLITARDKNQIYQLRAY